jgi:hypothetical protein
VKINNRSRKKEERRIKNGEKRGGLGKSTPFVGFPHHELSHFFFLNSSFLIPLS